ncbi:MAG: hypothetical protein HOW73_09500 [Polyangiaceae bacterium]|nr:hypothetical protein [Polyangiaceae bacterium]
MRVHLVQPLLQEALERLRERVGATAVWLTELRGIDDVQVGRPFAEPERRIEIPLFPAGKLFVWLPVGHESAGLDEFVATFRAELVELIRLEPAPPSTSLPN